MSRYLKADLHVHTCYSHDSTAPLQSIVDQCLRTGIDCLAITDHNTIEGALALQGQSPIRIIVGEEVESSEGDIIGLFLNETIPPGLTPAATIDAIKRQGGVVIMPHPFDRVRNSAIGMEAYREVADRVDAIETFNARNLFQADDAAAQQVAEDQNLPQTSVTDSHCAAELGRAYTTLPEFGDSPAEFLDALSRATLTQRRARWLLRLAPTLARVRRYFARK